MEKIILRNGIVMNCHSNNYITNIIKGTNDFYEIKLIHELLSHKDSYNQILDIGANIGNHSICLATKFPNAEIHAFEPLKRNYELLVKNINENSFRNIKSYNTSFNRKGDYVKSLITSMDEFKKVDLIKLDIDRFDIFILELIDNILQYQSPTVMITFNEKKISEIITKMAELNYYVVYADVKNNLIFSKKKYMKYKLEKEHFEKSNEMNIKIIDTIVTANEKISLENANLKEKLEKSNEKINLSNELAAKYKQSSEKYCSKYEYEKKLLEEYKKYKKSSEKYHSNYLYEKSLLEKERERTKQLSKTLDEYIDISRTFAKRTYHEKKTYNRVLNKVGITVIPYDFVKYISKYELDAKSRKLEREKFVNEIKVGHTYTSNKKASINTISTVKKTDIIHINKSYISKSFEKVKVASILDEFSYTSFNEVCELKQLSPENFESELLKFKPDVFFCESAWSGFDPLKSGRPWQGKIYSSINFKNENRPQLLKILKICNENGIPTIFWNKEDPTHFHDKVHNFIDTARLFDYVFTTDSSCVDEYEEQGFDFIDLLPFSTNVDLDNDVEKTTNEIIFFGSWYANHVNRCNEMSEILNLLIENEFKFKIYDRYSEDSDPNHIYPEEFKPYIYPSMSQKEVIEYQKGMKYGLNFNTVVDSETMLARRVYELAANKVLVISNYSKAIENLLGDNCIILPRDIEKLKNLTTAEYEIMVENAYNIVSQQTYFARFKSVLDSIGYPSTISVNHIVNISSVEQIDGLDFNIVKGDKIYLLLEETVSKLLDYSLIEKYNNKEVTVLRKEFFSQNSKELYCYSNKINHISIDEREKMINKGIIANSSYTLVRGKNVI